MYIHGINIRSIFKIRPEDSSKNRRWNIGSNQGVDAKGSKVQLQYSTKLHLPKCNGSRVVSIKELILI
jgi:hypothetical protein